MAGSYSKTLPTGAVLEKSVPILQQKRQQGQEEKVKECAHLIREEVLNMEQVIKNWSPSESDVTSKNIKI